MSQHYLCKECSELSEDFQQCFTEHNFWGYRPLKNIYIGSQGKGLWQGEKNGGGGGGGENNQQMLIKK